MGVTTEQNNQVWKPRWLKAIGEKVNSNLAKIIILRRKYNNLRTNVYTAGTPLFRDTREMMDKINLDPNTDGNLYMWF